MKDFQRRKCLPTMANKGDSGSPTEMVFACTESTHDAKKNFEEVRTQGTSRETYKLI